MSGAQLNSPELNAYVSLLSLSLSAGHVFHGTEYIESHRDLKTSFIESQVNLFLMF